MLLYVRKAQLTKPSRQIPQVGKTMLRALWMMRRRFHEKHAAACFRRAGNCTEKTTAFCPPHLGGGKFHLPAVAAKRT